MTGFCEGNRLESPVSPHGSQPQNYDLVHFHMPQKKRGISAANTDPQVESNPPGIDAGSLRPGVEKTSQNGEPRAFKGVWICAALWLHPDLTHTEKFLMAEVDSLTGPEDPCYATASYLASRIQVSEVRANHLLADLHKRGLLVKISFDGVRVRRVVNPVLSSNPATSEAWIKTRVVKNDNPKAKPCQKRQPCLVKSDNPGLSKMTTIDTQKRIPAENTNDDEDVARAARNGHAPDPVAQSSSSSSFDFSGFKLSEEQKREVLGTWLKTKGHAYVQAKARIARKQPNPSASFMNALRQDWQEDQKQSQAAEQEAPGSYLCGVRETGEVA